MNQSVQIFIYQLINENPDMSSFSISLCEKKIRTCPDFYLSIEYLKSGLVQISYLDVSRFEIFDRKFRIWTCPNFNFGHVRIFFSIENLKSGRVQISISNFRFYPWTCRDWNFSFKNKNFGQKNRLKKFGQNIYAKKFG